MEGKWSITDVDAFVAAASPCGNFYSRFPATSLALASRSVAEIRLFYQAMCRQVASGLYLAGIRLPGVDRSQKAQWIGKAAQLLEGKPVAFARLLVCFWHVRRLPKYQVRQDPLKGSAVALFTDAHVQDELDKEVVQEIFKTDPSLLSVISPAAPSDIGFLTQPPRPSIPAPQRQMSVNNLDTSPLLGSVETQRSVYLVARSDKLVVALTAAKLNANLQLKFKQLKSVSRVACHINKKWASVVPRGYEFRLFPKGSAMPENFRGYGKDSRSTTIDDLLSSMGYPEEPTLLYDLIQSVKSSKSLRRSTTSPSSVPFASNPSQELPQVDDVLNKWPASDNTLLRAMELGGPGGVGGLFEEASRDSFSVTSKTIKVAAELDDLHQLMDDSSLAASIFTEPPKKKRRV